MKIAIIASIWISVPPKNFGTGAQEYLAYHLAEKLIERGHEVTLFASGDSQTNAELKSVTNNQVIDYPSRDIRIKDYFELMNLSKAYTLKNEFDIIHNHLLPYGLLFSPLIDTPTVHTLHQQIYTDRDDRSEILMYQQYKTQRFISISHAQQRIVPELNYMGTVYNGIDENEFTFKDYPEGDYLLYLGRVIKYKGIHTAIKVAQKLGKKLKIAGPLPPQSDTNHKAVMQYWEEITPQFTQGIEYIGSVEGEEKVRLLQNAKAILFPIEQGREEPFGMTLIEAMSCGTPVIGFNGGAVPEIVKNGVTGYIANYDSQGEGHSIKETGEKGLEKAIETLYALSPEKELEMRKAAREHVERMFTIDRMVDGYERIYKTIIG